MKKILALNCCLRNDSRTLKIFNAIVNNLHSNCDVELVNIESLNCKMVDSKVLEDRNNMIVPEDMVTMAKKVANADNIVIGAPFWDMSFPAMLKVFFENMSLFNITFTDNGTKCVGLCKCTDVVYITTRGMDISTGDPLEQATPYIKALSWLWGLGKLHVISAQNLDYSSEDIVDQKINKAIEEGLALCEEII